MKKFIYALLSMFLIISVTLPSNAVVCYSKTNVIKLTDKDNKSSKYFKLKVGKNVIKHKDLLKNKWINFDDGGSLLLPGSGEYKVTIKKLYFDDIYKPYVPVVTFDFHVYSELGNLRSYEGPYGFDWYENKSIKVPIEKYTGRGSEMLRLCENIEQSQLDWIADDMAESIVYYGKRVTSAENFGFASPCSMVYNSEYNEEGVYGDELWTVGATIPLYVPKGKVMFINFSPHYLLEFNKSLFGRTYNCLGTASKDFDKYNFEFVIKVKKVK